MDEATVASRLEIMRKLCIGKYKGVLITRKGGGRKSFADVPEIFPQIHATKPGNSRGFGF